MLFEHLCDLKKLNNLCAIFSITKKHNHMRWDRLESTPWKWHCLEHTRSHALLEEPNIELKSSRNSEWSCLSNTYACGNLRSSCAVVPGMDTCHIHPFWCMNTALVQDCYYSSIIISLLQKRCRTFKSTCLSNWNREGNSTQTTMNDRKIRLCLLSCRCQDP